LKQVQDDESRLFGFVSGFSQFIKVIHILTLINKEKSNKKENNNYN